VSDATIKPAATLLSEELVTARHDLGSIERRRERLTLGDQGAEAALQSDYLSVIANALVSIATSLETSAVAERLAEIGDVLETREITVRTPDRYGR
jgi:hypothetical protein